MRHAWISIVAAFSFLLGQPAWPHEDETPPGGVPERLGQVNFPVSCSAAAQAEFNRSVALLHSFYYHCRGEGVHPRDRDRPRMRDGILGRRDELVVPAVVSPDRCLARAGQSRRGQGAKRRSEDRTRARVHRSHRRVLSGLRQAKSSGARTGLRKRDAATPRAVRRGSRSHRVLCACDASHHRPKRQDLREATEERGTPGTAVCRATRSSGACALHHPRL